MKENTLNSNLTQQNLSSQLAIGLAMSVTLLTAKKKFNIGQAEDVINDLIFDGWNNKKADSLVANLAALETQNITGLESPSVMVMERIQRLAKMREHADSGRGDPATLYKMIEQGHQRVLETIKACFKF